MPTVPILVEAIGGPKKVVPIDPGHPVDTIAKEVADALEQSLIDDEGKTKHWKLYAPTRTGGFKPADKSANLLSTARAMLKIKDSGEDGGFAGPGEHEGEKYLFRMRIFVPSAPPPLPEEEEKPPISDEEAIDLTNIDDDADEMESVRRVKGKRRRRRKLPEGASATGGKKRRRRPKGEGGPRRRRKKKPPVELEETAELPSMSRDAAAASKPETDGPKAEETGEDTAAEHESSERQAPSETPEIPEGAADTGADYDDDDDYYDDDYDEEYDEESVADSPVPPGATESLGAENTEKEAQETTDATSDEPASESKVEVSETPVQEPRPDEDEPAGMADSGEERTQEGEAPDASSPNSGDETQESVSPDERSQEDHPETAEPTPQEEIETSRDEAPAEAVETAPGGIPAPPTEPQPEATSQTEPEDSPTPPEVDEKEAPVDTTSEVVSTSPLEFPSPKPGDVPATRLVEQLSATRDEIKGPETLFQGAASDTEAGLAGDAKKDGKGTSALLAVAILILVGVVGGLIFVLRGGEDTSTPGPADTAAATGGQATDEATAAEAPGPSEGTAGDPSEYKAKAPASLTDQVLPDPFPSELLSANSTVQMTLDKVAATGPTSPKDLGEDPAKAEANAARDALKAECLASKAFDACQAWSWLSASLALTQGDPDPKLMAESSKAALQALKTALALEEPAAKKAATNRMRVHAIRLAAADPEGLAKNAAPLAKVAAQSCAIPAISDKYPDCSTAGFSPGK